MQQFPPHPVLKFLVFLGLLSLCAEVLAIKLVDVTPSVKRYRRNLEEGFKRKRQAERSKPVPPPSSNNRKPSRALGNPTASNFPSNTRHKRQDLNLSCNNVTVTPPGFDGSCGPGRPCPNGACWYVVPTSWLLQ